MAGTQLTPENIKSPFQLMAAWFSMLVLVVTVLLTAAANITKPHWAAGFLVIFASSLILVVITCVILMLTKFRPNLQEGPEYAQWLKDQGAYSISHLETNQTSAVLSPTQHVPAKQLRAVPESNDNYLISVANAVGAIELVKSFENAGFDAEVYMPLHQEPRHSMEESESIWIGSRVDPRTAIMAIRLAVNHWPELKYVHLSSDSGDPPDYVHDELFFGGASPTARRYRLKKWSNHELLELDESMTTEAFHSAIRQRYP